MDKERIERVQPNSFKDKLLEKAVLAELYYPRLRFVEGLVVESSSGKF